MADIKSALEGEHWLLCTTLGEIEEVFSLAVPRVIRVGDDTLILHTKIKLLQDSVHQVIITEHTMYNRHRRTVPLIVTVNRLRCRYGNNILYLNYSSDKGQILLPRQAIHWSIYNSIYIYTV